MEGLFPRPAAPLPCTLSASFIYSAICACLQWLTDGKHQGNGSETVHKGKLCRFSATRHGDLLLPASEFFICGQADVVLI